MTTNSITSSQRKQVVRFMEDGLDALTLDKDGAQRIIENGGEFQVGLKELIQKHSVTNQFADEEVESSYTYPKEYRGPKQIVDQIKAIAEIFGLDPSNALEFAKNLPELPNGAEGWFAIPTVDAVAAKHFPEVTDPADRYCRAVKLVLEKIGKSRKFYNYREGEITPNRLRQHARTLHALGQIGETQKGDILIVPAQYGMRHRGRSVRRAREVFVAGEFGLGAFAVGCMALTHPDRYVRWEELDTDCAGDEFASDADGGFSSAPVFYFYGGRVRFNASWFDDAVGGDGSVSGFVPQ
jgi:hypothetical protein